MKNLTKKVYLFLIALSAGCFMISATFAERNERGIYGSSPMEILDNVASEANQGSEIQETMLNDATDQEGGYASQYKIANTLDYVRKNIAPYLQWIVYIGLVLSVILIIYNGFLMVTNAIHKQGDMTKVKKNLINITIGVLLLTGFYALIKIVVGLINSIFGGYGGSTGF